MKQHLDQDWDLKQYSDHHLDLDLDIVSACFRIRFIYFSKTQTQI
jgi:hypothetical protein